MRTVWILFLGGCWVASHQVDEKWVEEPTDTAAAPDTDVEGDADTDADSDTDTDADTDADADTDGGRVRLEYGWHSDFDIDAGSSTGEGGELFYVHEPARGVDVCTVYRTATAEPSAHSCPDCAFALRIDHDVYRYVSSQEIGDSSLDGCEAVGWTFDSYGALEGDTPSSWGGMGFADYYNGYDDVTVYYFQAYAAWYAVSLDSAYDDGRWTYTYQPSSFYFYAYY